MTMRVIRRALLSGYGLQRLAVGCALLLASLALPAAALEPGELLARIDRNLFPPQAELYLSQTNFRPNAAPERVVIYLVRKGPDRVAALVVAPEHLKGVTVLRKLDQLLLHYPGELDPRTTGLSNILTGGSFSNAELFPVDFSSEYTAQVAEETPTELKLRLSPRNSSQQYHHAVMVVDKQLMEKGIYLPSRVDYLGGGEYVIRSVRFSGIKRFGELPPRPARLEVETPSNHAYRSIIEVGEMRKRELDDEVFTLKRLATLGKLLDN